jgi:hypothetical protein
MTKFVCTVCGYVHEGNTPPEKCPICGAFADKFVKQETISGERVWADEHKIGVAQGLDKQVVQGLKDHFAGECTEVGMYLAMSRQADREGFPEIAEAYKRIAFEEAEHASKFAEYGRNFWNILDKDDMSCAVAAIDRTAVFLTSIEIPSKLSELGIDDSKFEEMAGSALKYSKIGRFKSLSKEDIVDIYKAAL